MGRIFGTDGVRGIANGDLSIGLATNIGRAAGMVVEKETGRQPTFLVGKDTRISSDMLEAAISAGLCSAGANVIQIGVVPTPAVAYLVTRYGAQAGVMLSASHNPYEYNGIKLFSGAGFKLRDEQEEEIERIVLDGERPYSIKSASEIGTISFAARAADDYVDYLKTTLPGGLSGMRLAIDCSNGSASVTAKKLFEGLGAECTIFCAEPDGLNINWHCGSTHIEELSRKVRMGSYDLGLAFDGDADRCLAVDENGALVDGDKLLALFAYHLKEQGRLKNNTLVATVMSNLGLFKFAEKHGIEMRATKVGDRYVLETMLNEGFCIGGEQSGHIIFRDFMTTGDGQLSGLQLAGLLKKSGQKLSEAASLMETYPQTLLNIHATPEMKASLEQDQSVQEAIRQEEEKLGGNGRILVRPSGTEPLIRIMIEGQDIKEIERMAQRIASVIQG
ncbi:MULTISPECIES: phosphoglucosamine mutase [unclassified Anaerotruncus]|uniref:phosphoglucosamine mutase n=1 Tax=unclassified Anaerotruncus TaxID=2641626 RepID=UPI00033EDBB4|nr:MULTISPECIES: phosphoglucosamine mutase [unclassified Anaerotruncus]MCI9159959.1 phosphoglucosamine mutase [Anaerotruncus sp.]NCE75729.1 phosphoglucosamine mutase [Anaerotruncus sp. X29]RKJ93787.1 phosphoglucosamine mutase [Anaerotruncus sp. 1XD22-93]EOS59109.1 phosphoglucosamine mutase [Anaerotruncus sp. G3(2012)]MCI9235334.1 phosphoglucosamine mutase [Anaerotruncus sp.]